jgi:hypothetical protein
VAKGCWYVVVRAEGYESRVSPVVGVPPEVTDLDLALTPDATPAVDPDVTFSAATYTVAELDTTATLTVELSQAAEEIVTVEYTTSDGTAEAGSDYTPVTSTLTFLPGITQKTFAITINADSQEEPDETVNVTLRSPFNAVLGTPESATLTILAQEAGDDPNDDPDTPDPDAPDVQFSAAAYQVAEDAQTAALTVTLSTAAEQSISVDYATSDGTAEAGSDYTAITETLTFDPGVITQTIALSITNDTQNEADETLTIELREPVNANLGEPASAMLTIVDNDAAATPGSNTQVFLPLVRR